MTSPEARGDGDGHADGHGYGYGVTVKCPPIGGCTYVWYLQMTW